MTLEEYENFDKLARLGKFLFLNDFCVINNEASEINKIYYIKDVDLYRYYAGRVLNSDVEIRADLANHFEITGFKMEISIDGVRSSIDDLRSLISELRKTITVDDE